jgi:hypothetical protein
LRIADLGLPIYYFDYLKIAVALVHSAISNPKSEIDTICKPQSNSFKFQVRHDSGLIFFSKSVVDLFDGIGAEKRQQLVKLCFSGIGIRNTF